MDLKAANVVNAYADAAKRVADRAPGMAAGDSSLPSGPSFADVVKDVVAGAADNLAASETTALRAVSSETELLDVVTAVTNAELTLQTVVTVRDRVIQAYQDIIKMPI